MPLLESEVQVSAPRDVVYDVAKDVESFPSFMPDVESVQMLESSEGGDRTVTKWVGLVPEFKQKVRWTEEDVWNRAEGSCVFKQTEGDYQVYEGEWRFVDLEAGHTLFKSTIRYDLEIPLIGPLLKTLIAKKMRDNTDKILTAIKNRAEEKARGESS